MIDKNPIFPTEPGRLSRALGDLWRRLATDVNAMGEGRLSGYLSKTAAPTAGTWAKGDFVRNSNPAEAGVAGSKYLITGWMCTASGTPGTWVQSRTLTGN